MYRVFISHKNQCKSNCKYCFSKWDDLYKGFDSNYQLTDISDDIIVVYPTCDCDINIDFDYLKNILNHFYNNKYVVFSISTKNSLNDTQLKNLIALKNILKDKGMIKIGVGFTSKYSIQEIEPNTSSYESRINLLRKLNEYGIPSSVVFKPILPFVDINEYKEIINDTKFINYYLLGGLYINKNTEFFKTYINNKYSYQPRTVSWYKNESWLYVDNIEHSFEISKHISHNSGKFFYSDTDLIDNMISEKKA